MQYTGNVNKFLWHRVLPFLLLFYVVNLVWSYYYFSNDGTNKMIEEKRDSVRTTEVIDGVILGGSNALYGVSALKLSEESGLTWRNLALLSEGHSINNYFDFLSSSLTDEQKIKMSYVIFSSGKTLDNRLITDSSTSLNGRKKLSFRPQRSIASNIKNRLYPPDDSLRVRIDEYGDIDFNSTICLQSSLNPRQYLVHLSESDLDEWVMIHLSRLLDLFPNAKIIVTLPNGFNGKKYPYALRTNFSNLLKLYIEKFASDNSRLVYLINEKPYPFAKLMCNGSWHANIKGREWRTENLLEFLSSIVFKS